MYREVLSILLDQASRQRCLARVLEQESGVSIVFNEQYLASTGTCRVRIFRSMDVSKPFLINCSLPLPLKTVRTGDYQVVITPQHQEKPKQATTFVALEGIIRGQRLRAWLLKEQPFIPGKA